MPTSSDFLGGISVNDSGSAEQVNHRAVQLLKTGAGSRHLRRYDYVPTGMRRQHADRFAPAAAKTVAHHSPSQPLAGHEPVAVVLQRIRQASQHEQLIVPGS